MGWIGPAFGFAANALFGGGGGGGGGGGQSNQYIPTGLGGADQNWQGANNEMYRLAQGGQNATTGGYQDSFNRSNAMDWGPYMQRAGQAGSAYGQAGDAAMGQMGQYGQMADTARGQQGQMYGASRDVLNTAFDPQQALYGRTAQREQDQIRAGQAARGLGNSETGMMEEAGAMANFNIDWQNAQLGRQATGIQAADGAQRAGMGQGQLAGANMSAGLAAGGAGAGYYGQAGQVPMTAQQNWANAPGQASDQLNSGYGTIATGYSNAAAGAIPYMNAGNGALQTNYSQRYQANRDMSGALGQMGSALAPKVAGWFGNGSNGPQQSYDPSQYSVPGGGDTYYGPGQNWGI